jgi:5'-AMP-activated protein kinase catalytic alpha subunit
MKRITIPEIRLHPWFQHKLPPYLRHPPDLMEKQERVVDPQVIDEVMKLPFHKAYENMMLMVSNSPSNNMNNNPGNRNNSMMQHQPPPIITRELVEAAAALEDSREDDAPKFVRDLRVAYELILDHKHTRLRVMEVARAIQEAASATPPAFSPGASRGASPGTRSGYSSRGSYIQSSNSPSLHHTDAQMRLAEEAAQTLIKNTPGARGVMGVGSYQRSMSLNNSQHQILPPPPSLPMPGGVSGSSTPVVQMQSSIPGNVGMIVQHQQGRRNRRWYLGIQSKKDPAHVMTEVYKALMALGCDWLQLSSYRIKCRWRPQSGQMMTSSHTQPISGGETIDAAWNQNSQIHQGGQTMTSNPGGSGTESKMKVISGEDGHYVEVPNLNTPEYCIKIGLTLYKVQQNIYLLDFQKMTGDAFSFMTLCANIITELKNLSAASKKQQQLLAQQQVVMAQQQAAMHAAASGIHGLR